ncbi:MAG: tetraacyldisaccharide 4'-kinase, partial [Gemmatimonadetes bacterium]|nr:tetraacyldisaccharide 4'-kinase [Gemmatimonadota bacterium]
MRPALSRWTLAWWSGGHGALGSMLRAATWPAEALFGSVTGARNAGYARGWLRTTQAPIPVVSIGNLTVGGVGKTPFAAWLAGEVARWGRCPAIVLRGYGSDEVQVHAELNPDVPVFVAPRRAIGVAEAARAGRDVAILDDAFQHRALSRDLDVVLVSSESWTDRRRLLPRGPWRESITALRRAGVVVVT